MTSTWLVMYVWGQVAMTLPSTAADCQLDKLANQYVSAVNYDAGGFLTWKPKASIYQYQADVTYKIPYEAINFTCRMVEGEEPPVLADTIIPPKDSNLEMVKKDQSRIPQTFDSI